MYRCMKSVTSDLSWGQKCLEECWLGGSAGCSITPCNKRLWVQFPIGTRAGRQPTDQCFSLTLMSLSLSLSLSLSQTSKHILGWGLKQKSLRKFNEGYKTSQENWPHYVRESHSTVSLSTINTRCSQSDPPVHQQYAPSSPVFLLVPLNGPHAQSSSTLRTSGTDGT